MKLASIKYLFLDLAAPFWKKIKISEILFGKNHTNESITSNEFNTSFKDLVKLLGLILIIDDNTAHITMVYWCCNEICGHNNKVKIRSCPKSKTIFMSKNCIECLSSVTISLSSNSSQLDYFSKTLFTGPLFIIESKTCCIENVPLWLFDIMFALRLSKICIFRKAMKLQKPLADPIKLMCLSFHDTSMLYGTIQTFHFDLNANNGQFS